MAKNSIIKATTNSEILSYFINQNPELASEIDLPVQGQSTVKYGDLIMDNARYKNAFINTVNLIGLTIIRENRWSNPWAAMTDKGTLRYGSQIREIIQDLAKVFDYNKNLDNKTKFLETEVPDVYQYIHQLNFQKFYQVTINDSELRMAFNSEEDGLYNFIVETIQNLYETYEYDKFQLDKYQLMKRFVKGTVPTRHIDVTNRDARDILAEMKGVSNLMSFKSPNYNPAGVRRATKLDKQYLMVDAMRTALNETSIYATSFFLNGAQVKTNLAMIDGFDNLDIERLKELLGDDYEEFTAAELESLSHVVGCIISDDFFMDYAYAVDGASDGMVQREFTNPSTLEKQVLLHVWGLVSTSPYANCIVFTEGQPKINSVTINPSEMSISAGQTAKLSATVSTGGLANKAVVWSVEEAPGQTEANPVTVDMQGNVRIPADYDVSDENTIVIKATSVYDDQKSGECSITVL